MNAESSLGERIASRRVTVGVMGLGYVGLPLASAFVDAGVRVVGFDIDPEKIEKLGRGEGYLKHFGDGFFERLSSSALFEATSELGRLDEPDAVLICLPTPIDAERVPDLSYVVRAGERVGRRLRGGQLVVLESTTYPGTTRGELRDAIERTRVEAGRGDLALGRDWFLAYSPEREDPGSASHTTKQIPKLVGGVDGASGGLASALYALAIDEVVSVSSAEVAEAAKLLENVYRAVNIALVNEMKVILGAMGIDVWEVVRAAATKPFGFMPFYPGPGLGGHCIPVDPFYLAWKAREAGVPTRFVELAGEVNRSMPGRVVYDVEAAIEARGGSIEGADVLVIGAAYKPNVDDVRETPAAEVIELLRRRGAVVRYHDPHVPVFPSMRNYEIGLESVTLDAAAVSDADAVVIVTDHDDVDWSLIASRARLIVDTRDAIRRRVHEPPGPDRLVLA